jgi:hypothetical protein
VTVRVEQRYFWQTTGEMSLVVNRLPECQRRSALADVELEGLEYELYQADDSTFVLRNADQQWAVSTTDCELMDKVPAGGQKVGTFRLEGEEVKFEAAAAAGQQAPEAQPPAAQPPAARPEAAPPAQ